MTAEQERRIILDKLFNRHCSECGKKLKVEMLQNKSVQIHVKLINNSGVLELGKKVEEEITDTALTSTLLTHKCKATGHEVTAGIHSYLSPEQCKEVNLALSELMEKVD